MSETAAVISLDGHFLGLAGHTLVFRSADHGHNLQRIDPGRKPNHVDTTVRAIVAHQLAVYAGIVAILATFNIYTVGRRVFKRHPLGIDRLQPTFGLGDVDTLVADFRVSSGFGSLGESDGGYILLELIVPVAGERSHAHCSGGLVDVHLCKIGGIVILDITASELQEHLIVQSVHTHRMVT